jgi:hypothetical protein
LYRDAIAVVVQNCHALQRHGLVLMRAHHRGHSTHMCKGCFKRPANSPAATPEPA